MFLFKEIIWLCLVLVAALRIFSLLCGMLGFSCGMQTLNCSTEKKWSHSVVSDSFLTSWTVACQAPPFMGFSRQEYHNGLPFPSPGDLPNPGVKPRSPSLQADSLLCEPPGRPPDQGWRADSLERLWFWERLKAEREGDVRGWDGWMASLTRWTWV